ncbi:type II toxin-antitoxin system RelE/ParE family toxin [candidate division KSB1 bacterium]|nr:type II toxin-antitoxin system RelE/ParE family toxin [candidate division KSB1 bacterium]
MTKKYKVKLTQHAQEDLEHIFYYIAADSISNASNFVIELEEKVYSLEQFPNRNPLIPENEYFETDYRHLIFKKYRIIYRVSENSVFILRIIRGDKLLDL